MAGISGDRLKFNNFDLLRLILAAVVCLVHSYQLSGFADLAFLGQFLSSGMAVQAFFVISGFLIFMSYERSSSLRSYAEKRIRRILPAYLVVVLLCAFGLPLASAGGASGYFSGAWANYLAANLTFLNGLYPSLPGVFEGNRMPAINGALWTIKIEVMFYAAVPVLVLCMKRFGKGVTIGWVYLLSIAYSSTLGYVAERTGTHLYAELGRQLLGQLSYFMTGAFLYYFLPLFEKHVRACVLSAVAILAINASIPLTLLAPAAIGVVVVFLALFCYLGDFGKHGDFSYGVYILHFPIIQALLAGGWFAGRPFAFLGAVIGLAGLGAMLMWYLVESRFLRRTATQPQFHVHHPLVGAGPAQPTPGR